MSHFTFTGNSRRTRQVNLSGRKNVNPFAITPTFSATPSQANAVTTAYEARERRQHERKIEIASKVIQRYWRGHASRIRLNREWRGQFDQNEKSFAATHSSNNAPYDNEEQALTQIRLLIRFSYPVQKQGFDRLNCYLLRQASVLNNLSFARSAAWPYALLRLEYLIIRYLNLGFSTTETLSGLADVVTKIPDLSARNASSLYSTIRELIPKLSEPSFTSLLRIITPPLTNISIHSENAYVAFASEILTLSILQRAPHKCIIDLLCGTVNYKLLSHSLLSVLRTSTHSAKLDDHHNRSTLLGFLILFQKDTHSYSILGSADDYLNVVSELLPSAAKDANNSFVFDQVLSLTKNISQLSSTGLDDEAKGLASFAIALLRNFPEKTDEIRISLYRSSSGETGKKIPALKFFWQVFKVSKIFNSISAKAENAIPLLNGHLDQYQGDLKALQDEWRVLLLFLELYTFAVKLMDDEEFLSPNALMKKNGQVSWASQNALLLEDIALLVQFLKNLGYALYFHSSKISPEPSRGRDSGSIGSYFELSSIIRVPKAKKAKPSVAQIPGISVNYLKYSITGVLRMLYERDSRRSFLPTGSWLILSHFDMENFIKSVVEEEERRNRLLAESEDEDDDGNNDKYDNTFDEDDEEDLASDFDSDFESDEESSFVGTGHGAKVRRRERLQRKQRWLARQRKIQSVAPRLSVLQNMPFFIPFDTRVQIFRQFIHLDQHQRKGRQSHEWRGGNMGLDFPLQGPRHLARIHRNTVFDDAFDAFWDIGEGLKDAIQITFVDAFDNEEAGIDGGGVTKEFLTTVIQEAFNPPEKLNMFVENEQHFLYPNPSKVEETRYFYDNVLKLSPSTELASQAVPTLLQQYEFLGRIIGKCLYEGILVDVNFAGFFLLKWALTGGAGHAPKESGYRANLNDLREMDEGLYQGLIRLKNYDGDVSDLSLDFTIDNTITIDEDNGTQARVTKELKPGGSKIAVTNENRLIYISYVARHRLQIQPAAQTSAFLRGLSTMIQPAWLSMFNQSELQTLLSGTKKPVDIDDLRRHTNYGGVYVIGDDNLEHPTIQMFWEVLEEMDDSERREVLRFVTSTPRAPLLGFGSLTPSFAIRDSGSNDSRLPSASTCVNLLKLPIYREKKVLKEKLLAAVLSGAGFDLS